MRKDDIEFRWSAFNKKYELVQWFDHNGKELCIVIAFYNVRSEGYEISFVGNRPFNVDNSDLVWKMLKYGQKVCDAEFDLNPEID